MNSVWIEITTGDEEALTKLHRYLEERNPYNTEMAEVKGTTLFEIPEEHADLLRKLLGRKAFRVRRELGGRVLTPKPNQHRADFSHKAQLGPTLKRGVLARGVGKQKTLPFRPTQ